MRYLFALITIAISQVASPQHDDLYYFKKRLEKQKQEKTRSQIQSPVLLRDKSNNTKVGTREYDLPGGEKVTILPQDNMPCVKPDMNQFNMPNAGTPEMLKQKPAIPNPGYDSNLNSIVRLRREKVTITDYRYLGKK